MYLFSCMSVLQRFVYILLHVFMTLEMLITMRLLRSLQTDRREFSYTPCNPNIGVGFGKIWMLGQNYLNPFNMKNPQRITIMYSKVTTS